MGAHMNISIILFWFASFLSLAGAYLVSEHRREGFIFWILANPLIILQTYLTNSWNLVFLYIIFWILAVRGYTKKPREKEISYQEAMNIVFKPKTDSVSFNNPIKKNK